MARRKRCAESTKKFPRLDWLDRKPATAELAKDSRLRIGSESKNLDDARELRLVSSAKSKSATGMPSFKRELISLKAPGRKIMHYIIINQVLFISTTVIMVNIFFNNRYYGLLPMPTSTTNSISLARLIDKTQLTRYLLANVLNNNNINYMLMQTK